MPRRPRLVIAGIPLHVTQRRVNRAAIFLDQHDHRPYLELMSEVAATHVVSVHALMSNHVHLFITPSRPDDLAQAMRLLNQCYVASFNRRHRRTGTLWESRFLVDSQCYALTRYRHIELNAVVPRWSMHPSAVRGPAHAQTRASIPTHARRHIVSTSHQATMSPPGPAHTAGGFNPQSQTTT